MNCPLCGGETVVRGSRADCKSVQRRRLCRKCGHRFYTSEHESDGKEYRRVASQYEWERYQKSIATKGGQATKHPCKRDCPERSATCHSTCERWATYEKARNAEYAERARQRAVDDGVFAQKEKIKMKNYKKSGKWR